MNAQVDYDLANQYSNYERYHRYVTEDENFEISSEMESIINKIELDNPAAIEAPKYRAYVESVIQEAAWNSIKDDEELKSEPGAMTHASMSILDDRVKSPEVKDLALYQIMKSALYDGLQSEEQNAYDRFKNENQNEAYLAQINTMLNKWERLSAGKAAPGFEYPDIEGNEISLDDMKGKVVYIDVWATWCGPCKAEHPDLEKLESQYASNPSVAFVGVSIDEDKAAWEKMVAEKEMKGYQVIADNAWDSGIVKDYMIKGIPRFILIDADGKIIDASAPRPSSGKVADLIDSELKKSAKEALLVH
jgi:thiol-disulfide isomerase/thioredoxin